MAGPLAVVAEFEHGILWEQVRAWLATSQTFPISLRPLLPRPAIEGTMN